MQFICCSSFSCMVMNIYRCLVLVRIEVREFNVFSVCLNKAVQWWFFIFFTKGKCAYFNSYGNGNVDERECKPGINLICSRSNRQFESYKNTQCELKWLLIKWNTNCSSRFKKKLEHSVIGSVFIFLFKLFLHFFYNWKYTVLLK